MYSTVIEDTLVYDHMCVTKIIYSKFENYWWRYQ